MDMILTWRNNPNLNDKLQTLIEKMDHLESKANDIQCQVQNEELRARKRRKSEVKLWLERVKEIKEDVQSISTEVENKGSCNSKEMLNEIKQMAEQVEELLKQGEFSRGLVLDDLNPEGIELVIEKLEGSTSLMVKDEIWSALVRGESRVGICGMGGVGKTSMAMHINNEILLGRDDFKYVYYVTVSQGSSVHKLQEDISKALRLKLDNEDETKRAAELHMSLKKRDKYLLILDNVWEDIPMEKVGVAVEGDGCKLLITTRKRDVCRKMSCDTIIELRPLPENEAWDLFVNKLGTYESLSDVAKCAARSIAKECAGLPLGIITMAKCMRGECCEHVWREMLRQLQNPSSDQDDMENKVYKILELSYERLSNDRLRDCLLYCTLYPEDCQMEKDELIDHFIAVGLIDESSTEENIDKRHFLLNALESASLLECVTNYDGKRCVMMHDLIRDMAVKIIGCKGIVKPRKGLKEMPRKNEWTKDLVLVSLMHNDIGSIGDDFDPVCRNLSVLILRSNPLENVSHSFFVPMVGLRILDLSLTRIGKLPNSISNLCNLNALLLHCCRRLRVIPSLAGLTKLRVLNLSWCMKIKELPKGIEELINLKHLDLQWTNLQRIPDGLLCKLCKLETLLSNFQITILPKDLMRLRQMWRFQGRIEDFDAFNQFVGSDCFNQLKRYSFYVGFRTLFDYAEVDRCIRFYNCPSSLGTEDCFKVPHNVQALELIHCSFGAKCLLDAVPSLCGATELKWCSLQQCRGIEYIISDAWFNQGRDKVSRPFRGVQHLKLYCLDDFVGLVEREAVRSYIFFDGLRELEISHCPSVNTIWLQKEDLPNLEHIIVRHCKNMEEVFATAEGATVKDEPRSLPKLRKLNFHNLLELRSICRKGVFFPELQELEITKCPKLKNVGLVNHSMPSLEKITVVDCKEMEEIFERGDEAGHDVIQLPNLGELSLGNLPELRNICKKAFVCNNIAFVYLWGSSTGEKLENCPISVPRLLLNNNPPHPDLHATDKPIDWWNSLYWNDPDTRVVFNRLGCFSYMDSRRI